MKRVMAVLMAVFFLGATTGLSLAAGNASVQSQSSTPVAKKKAHHKRKKHVSKKKANSKATPGTTAK